MNYPANENSLERASALTDSGLAETFADSAMVLPAKKQIVIFTSNSLIAHLHLHDLMPAFIEMGIKPVIFLTPDSTSPRATIPSLQRFDYYEAGILNDVIYPILDSVTGMKPLTPTFNQLMARYDCAPRKIKSLKDPAVIAAINEPNNMGAISIYQDAIFKPDLIAAVKKNGFFWNLHPAILPQDQGLYLAFWSLLEGRTRHGYTLHEIDEGIDTGKRIALHESVLNPRKCVLESYLDSVKNGSKLVQDALSAYLKTGKIEFMPASDKKSAYHSFPTEDDISEAWDKDVRLWGTPEEMLGIYTKIFGEDEFLSTSIRSAIAKIENIEVPHFEFGLNTVYKTQNRHLEMVRKGPF